jgi:glycine cleavage system H lipoate-binding protein
MKEKTNKDKRSQKKRVMGFQVIENECIWMKAGVVNFRLCDNDFDCQNCPFDVGMRKAMGMDTQAGAHTDRPSWVEHLKKKYHGASRPCRHALMGRIDAPKICTMNYECYHCPFDQMLDDLELGLFAEAPNYRKVSGYRMAEGYYYHMGHAWARFEHGGRVRVGSDDFSNRVLGAPQTLDLPPLGADLKQNEVGWSLSRGEHKAAVLSPVTGKVLAINHQVREQPDIAHEDPYQHGWLFILEPDRPKQNLKGLYYGDESFKWLEQENGKLMALMGPEYEQLAATGGEPIDDVYDHFPEIGWDRLVRTFLRTEKLS